MERNILSKEEIKEMCKRMRLTAMDMAISAGARGAHVSGSLSCIEIYAVLYGAILNYDIDNPLWEERDRFIAGKEHARLAEFPAMAEVGIIPKEILHTYEENDGILVGHQRNLNLGIEYSSMSLGMGLSYAVGKALIAKQTGKSYRVFSLLGDAECEEGSILEAFSTASHYRLDNMIVIIDRNYMSVDGNTEELMAQRDMEEKLRAFGWDVVTVDGHDVSALISALEYIPSGKPYAVIAKTVKGKGVSFIENNKSWHQAVMNDTQYNQAIEEINKA